VAFSADGSLLACGGRDGIVWLWDVAAVLGAEGASIQPLRALDGQMKDVSSLAFSPDGALLASASWDGNVRVWGIVR